MRSKKVWKINENLEKIRSLKGIVENQTKKERIREVLDQCQLTLKPKSPKSLPFFCSSFSPLKLTFTPLHCLKAHPKPPTSYINTPFPYQFKAQLVFTKISFLSPNSLESVISKVPLVFWSSRSQFTKRDSSVLLVSSKFLLVFWNCIFVCKMTAWPKMIASLKI